MDESNHSAGASAGQADCADDDRTAKEKLAADFLGVRKRTKQELLDIEAEELETSWCGISFSIDGGLSPLQTREPEAVEGWFGYYPCGIFGEGGTGKSMLLQAVLTSLSTGQSYLGNVYAKHECIGWFPEDSPSELTMRQETIVQNFGALSGWDYSNLQICPRGKQDNYLVVPGGHSLKTTDTYDRLKDNIAWGNVSVIGFDGIAHIFAGDPNSTRDVTFLMHALRNLAPPGRPLCVILLGHTSRSEGSEYAGSAAFSNGLRRRFLLEDTIPGTTKPAGHNARYLSLRKNNYGGLDQSVRLEYRNGMFAPAAPVIDPNGTTVSRAEQARRHLTSRMRELQNRGVRITEGPRSPDYIVKVLEREKQLGNFSSVEISEALAGLLNDKLVENRICGKLQNGQPKFSLAVTP